jgi:hypothetical protein
MKTKKQNTPKEKNSTSKFNNWTIKKKNQWKGQKQDWGTLRTNRKGNGKKKEKKSEYQYTDHIIGVPKWTNSISSINEKDPYQDRHIIQKWKKSKQNGIKLLKCNMGGSRQKKCLSTSLFSNSPFLMLLVVLGFWSQGFTLALPPEPLRQLCWASSMQGLENYLHKLASNLDPPE